MKQALFYITVIIGVYIIVDIIIYLISSPNSRRLLGRGRKIPKGADGRAVADELKQFLRDVKDWMETERKLEYKSVWVGNRLADAIEARINLLKSAGLNESQTSQTASPDENTDNPLPAPETTDSDKLIDEALETVEILNAFGPKYVWTLLKAFGIAVILALFIRTFVVQAFKIPSGSMIPTLEVGDQLLVSKFRYGITIPFTDKKLCSFWAPRRGDVVVFRPPESVASSWQTHEIRIPWTDKVIYKWRSQVDFIKRIVGLPGDTIELKDGVVYVNGVEMTLEPKGESDYKRKTGDYVRTVGGLLFNENLDGRVHLVLHNDMDMEDMKSEDEGPFYVGPGEFFAMGDNRDDSQDSRRWGGAAAKIKDIRGRAFIIHFSWDPVENKPRLGRVGHLIH